jgi:hypothetical protein
MQMANSGCDAAAKLMEIKGVQPAGNGRKRYALQSETQVPL